MLVNQISKKEKQWWRRWQRRRRQRRQKIKPEYICHFILFYYITYIWDTLKQIVSEMEHTHTHKTFGTNGFRGPSIGRSGFFLSLCASVKISRTKSDMRWRLNLIFFLFSFVKFEWHCHKLCVCMCCEMWQISHFFFFVFVIQKTITTTSKTNWDFFLLSYSVSQIWTTTTKDKQPNKWPLVLLVLIRIHHIWNNFFFLVPIYPISEYYHLEISVYKKNTHTLITLIFGNCVCVCLIVCYVLSIYYYLISLFDLYDDDDFFLLS